MIKTIKHHVHSNYIEISLILGFLLSLFPLYALSFLMLCLIMYVFEVFLFCYFSGIEEEKINIILIKSAFLFLFPFAFFVLSIYMPIILNNLLIILLPMSFYFIADHLKNFDQYSFELKIKKTINLCLSVYILIFVLLILPSPTLLFTIFLGVLLSSIVENDPSKIFFDINPTIIGKIVIFLSLFASFFIMSELIIVFITIGCACLLVDDILLNFFDLNLSINKYKREPRSIYLSIAIFLMPISSLMAIPSLFLPASILCNFKTINRPVNDFVENFEFLCKKY